MRSLLPAALLTSLSCLALAAACSSSSSDDSSGIEPDASTGDAAGSDGGTTTDASSNDGATHGDGGGTGRISLIASTTASSPVNSGAYFGPSQTNFTCPTTVIGNCYHVACDGGLPGYAMPSDDPGMLTVTSGAVVLTYAPYQNQYAVPFVDGGSGFSPGSVITFAATGATVPAFSETLTMPELPTVAPLLSDGGTVVPRASDLVVTWSGGSATAIEIHFTRVDESAACFFDTPSGTTSATIPAATLQTLAAGDWNVGVFAEAKTESMTSYDTVITGGYLALGANIQLQ